MKGHSMAPSVTKAPPAIRYCLYARKSMEAEERQALSIDSQIKEMRDIAQRLNLRIVATKTEAHSAKDSGQRKVFNEVTDDIRSGRYNSILTWAPDRLSRNAGDLGRLVDLMDQGHLLEIRTYNQHFTNSPNEKFLLMILCSQAKLENDNKAINVKRGLRTRVEMGLWPSGPPTGYKSLHRTDRLCEVEVDRERAPIIKKMFDMVAYEQCSSRDVCNFLKEIDFRSPNNKHLSLSTVLLMLRRSFYYGEFEYPKKSGKWYKGKHEPIITKEVFDLVQERLDSLNVSFGKKSRIIAPFAFIRLMRCGACGNGISAREMHKILKGGEIHTFRYYMCTNSTKSACSQLYINEIDLIRQLTDIFDQVDVNLIGMREEIEDAINRYDKFQSFITGEPVRQRVQEERELDLRGYAKNLFISGTLEERRAILYRLRSKILVKDKKVYLDEEALQKEEVETPEALSDVVLELKTTDRGLAFGLMRAHALRPGQTYHLAGGATIMFQEEVLPKKKGNPLTVYFHITDLTGDAPRTFANYLRESLEHRQKSLKRIAINEKTTKLDTIEKTLQRELKTHHISAKA